MKATKRNIYKKPTSKNNEKQRHGVYKHTNGYCAKKFIEDFKKYMEE